MTWPIVNYVLDQFGTERVVFGGDWPVCTLAATYYQWVETLRNKSSPTALWPRGRNCSTTMRSGSIDFRDLHSTEKLRGQI